MDALLQLLSEKVSPLWHKAPIGIGLASFVSLSFLLWPALSGDASIHVIRVAYALVVFGAMSGLWWYTNKLPRNSKGRIGIALAIASEDYNHTRFEI